MLRTAVSAKAIAVVAAAAITLSACSLTSAGSDDPIRPLVAGDASAAATGTVAPTRVILGEDVTDPPTSLEGAGYTAEIRPGVEVEIPTRDRAATLLTATREDGTSLAAIAISAEELEQAPLVVDYHSTAFAMFLMSPEFITDDLFLISLLRGVVEQSAHFDALADAVAARDEGAIGRELAELADDVVTTTRSLVSEPAIDTAAVEPAAYTVVPAAGAATAVPANVGVGAECKDASLAPVPGVGLCLFSQDRSGAALRQLTIENQSRSWVAIFSDPALAGQGPAPIPQSLVPPRVFGGLAITELAENVGRKVTGELAEWMCDTARFIGPKCEDQDQLVAALGEMRLDTEGSAFTLVDEQSNIAETAVVSGMGGAPVDGSRAAPDAQMITGQSVTAVLNSWSTVVLPLINVTTGIRAQRRPDPAAAPDATAAEREAADVQRVEAIKTIVAASSDVQGLQAVGAAMAAGDLEAMSAALDTVTASMLGNNGLIEVFFKFYVGQEIGAWMIDQVRRSAAKTVVKAVPVVGWAVTAYDTVNAAAAGYIQASAYFTTFHVQPASSMIEPLWYHAVKHDEGALTAARAAALEKYDWATGAYRRVHETVGEDHIPEVVTLTGASLRRGDTALDLVGTLPTGSGAARYAVLFSSGRGDRTYCIYRYEAPHLIPRVVASTCIPGVTEFLDVGHADIHVDAEDLVMDLFALAPGGGDFVGGDFENEPAGDLTWRVTFAGTPSLDARSSTFVYAEGMWDPEIYDKTKHLNFNPYEHGYADDPNAFIGGWWMVEPEWTFDH